MAALIVELASIPLEQIRDWEATERAWGDVFANLPCPARLLVYSGPFAMRPAIAALDRTRRPLQLLSDNVKPLQRAIDDWFKDSAAPKPSLAWETLPEANRETVRATVGSHRVDAALENDDRASWQAVGDGLGRALWALPWQHEQQAFYEELGTHHLRAATFVLVLWPTPEMSSRALLATLRDGLGREVRQLDALPPAIGCGYAEEATRLVPDERGAPYLAALQSYDMRGPWTLRTLHPLLDGTDDVALAIDVQTLSRHAAQRLAELAHTAATVTAKHSTTKDARSERVALHADYVLHQLPHQGLHTVQIAVLVSGEDAEGLETNAATMQHKLGSSLRLMRPNGAQGELLKFWSTTPTKAIDAPHKPRTMLSHGVGCCAGVLTYHRAANTRGLLWGIDAARRSAVFEHLLDHQQAGHALALGITGGGKTVFLNAIMARAAALSGYRVIGIDDFDNAERVKRAFGHGARCDFLSMDTPMNPFDIVYGDDADEGEGGWLLKQVQHDIGQLSFILGSPSSSDTGKARLSPREFTEDERGLLDGALMRMHAGLSPDTPLEEMPLLDDLIVELERCPEREARRLARTLRITLYGTERRDATTLTSFGHCFNRHTAIDWRFINPITFYNTARVPLRLRALFYVQIIGAILRWMRLHANRNHPTLLVIDEFGHLTQVEALGRLAATIVKVARKYGVMLLAADQNPHTFLQNESGRTIWQLTVAKFFFHLEDTAIAEVSEAMQLLTPTHQQFIRRARFGQCVGVLRDNVYMLNNELGPREYHYFTGS